MSKSNLTKSSLFSTTSSDVTSDEWTIVSRGPRRRKGDHRHSVGNDDGIRFQYKQNASLALKKKHVTPKRRWQSVRDTVIIDKTHLSTSQWWLQTRASLLQAMGANTVQFVQCLGLGSFEASASSRHQLACAMLIRELFGTVLCTISDPILSAGDCQIAESLSFAILPSQPVDHVDIGCGCGILFMPHCEEDLNNAVLARWLLRNDVENLVMLGNTLSLYVRDDVSTSPIAILANNGRLVERICVDPKLSTLEAAFNNLSITTILPQQS